MMEQMKYVSNVLVGLISTYFIEAAVILNEEK
jgi:hypothetical protein